MVARQPIVKFDNPHAGDLNLKDRQNIIDRIEDILRVGEPARAAADHDTYLSTLYAYGTQWGVKTNGPEGFGVYALPRELLNADIGKKLRITINTIQADVRTQRSLFGLPTELPFEVVPASSSPADYEAASAGQVLLPSILRLGRVRQRYKDASDARIVMGTCFHLLNRRLTAKGVPLPDGNGGHVVDPRTGQAVMVPGNIIEPVLVWPHQVSVDPAVRSHRIEDHAGFTVTFAASIDQMEAWYDLELTDEEKKNLKPLGELDPTSRQLASLTEIQTMPFASNSNTPGALIHIAYWRDPDDPWLWPNMAVYTRTFDRQRRDGKRDGLLYSGISPIIARPLYRYDFEVPTGSFLGRGLPYMRMQTQDLLNICMSGVADHIANFSRAKLAAETGTITGQGNIDKWMANESNLVFWDRQQNFMQRPEYINPPAMASGLLETIPLVSSLGDRVINSGDIQRGLLKTHQAQGAVQMQGTRMDSPLEEMANEDHLELQEEVAAMLWASGRLMPNYQIDELTGFELTQQQLDDLKNSCIAGRRLDISVATSDLLPMTRSQKQTFIMGLAQSGRLQDPQTMRLLREQTGIIIDDQERLAVAQARDENRRFMAGKPVADPGMYELHAVHRGEHDRVLNTPGFKGKFTKAYEGLSLHRHETNRMEAISKVVPQLEQQMAVQHILGELAPQQGPGQPALPADNQAGPPTGGPGEAGGQYEGQGPDLSPDNPNPLEAEPELASPELAVA